MDKIIIQVMDLSCHIGLSEGDLEKIFEPPKSSEGII